MKTNKHTFDFIIRLCLYTLPFWLCFLTAISNKFTVSASSSSYNLSFNNVFDYYYLGDRFSNFLIPNTTTGSLYDIDSLPNTTQIYDEIDDVSITYANVIFTSDELSFFDNDFTYIIFTDEDHRGYGLYPNFTLEYNGITYIIFESEFVRLNTGGWDFQTTAYVLNDLSLLSIELGFDLTGFFYNTFSPYLDYNGSLSNSINAFMHNDSSSFAKSVVLWEFYSSPVVSVDFLDFNTYFSSITTPILDIPLFSSFFLWFDRNIFGGLNIAILKTIFSLCFYFVLVEFVILIKNVLVFIFFVANRLIERGLNVGKD